MNYQMELDAFVKKIEEKKKELKEEKITINEFEEFLKKEEKVINEILDVIKEDSTNNFEIIQFDSMETYLIDRSIFVIQENRIQKQLEEVINQMLYYSTMKRNINIKLKQKQLEKDFLYSKTAQEIREEAKEQKIKITENGIKESIETNEQLLLLKKDIVYLESILKYVEDLLNILKNKNYILLELLKNKS